MILEFARCRAEAETSLVAFIVCGSIYGAVGHCGWDGDAIGFRRVAMVHFDVTGEIRVRDSML